MAVDIVGSNMPDFASDEFKVVVPKRGYGQNQFDGASSDTPGQKTTSGFLPQPGTAVNDQTRKLGSAGKERVVPDAYGMASARSRQPNPQKEGI